MRTIRLGNDIRLNVTLIGVNDYDSSSIKQLRCYLIRNKSNIVKNPYPEYYISDEYNLNTCGIPGYRAFPINNGVFDPFSKSYNGFGVNSNKFYEHRRNADFLMPSRVLEEKNKIECYFPATEQRYLGEYKLVIVLVIYQSGWGHKNLRTYTIDYGNVFELVDDMSGESGDITIEVEGIELEKPQTDNSIYIGFDSAESADDLNIDLLTKYNYDKTQTYPTTCDVTGKYLWVCSKQEISQIMTGPFYVPIIDVQLKDDLYCYRSDSASKEGFTYDINIILK